MHVSKKSSRRFVSFNGLVLITVCCLTYFIYFQQVSLAPGVGRPRTKVRKAESNDIGPDQHPATNAATTVRLIYAVTKLINNVQISGWNTFSYKASLRKTQIISNIFKPSQIALTLMRGWNPRLNVPLRFFKENGETAARCATSLDISLILDVMVQCFNGPKFVNSYTSVVGLPSDFLFSTFCQVLYEVSMFIYKLLPSVYLIACGKNKLLGTWLTNIFFQQGLR